MVVLQMEVMINLCLFSKFFKKIKETRLKLSQGSVTVL